MQWLRINKIKTRIPIGVVINNVNTPKRETQEYINGKLIEVKFNNDWDRQVALDWKLENAKFFDM